MTWVKICGITNLEDARTAVEAGAAALGFVFYEKSPRNVTPDTERAIVRQMPAQAIDSMRSLPEAERLRNFLDTIFLDSGSLQQPGGTGITFDWRKAVPVV